MQRSYVLQRLNEIVPPRSLLNALARIDPFPSFAGPPLPTEPLDPRVLGKPGVRAAAPSIVRVLGTACGLGVEGSGWVAANGLVVTAAHVVAGEEDTEVVTLQRRRAARRRRSRSTRTTTSPCCASTASRRRRCS